MKTTCALLTHYVLEVVTTFVVVGVGVVIFAVFERLLSTSSSSPSFSFSSHSSSSFSSPPSSSPHQYNTLVYQCM